MRDTVALLKDLRFGEADEPGAVNVAYVARLCARDWRLHHDVSRSLARCRRFLPGFALPPGQTQKVEWVIGMLEEALSRERKTLRWVARGMVGERFPWSDTVDEREGMRVGLREHMR